jgi:hypothetical protein
VVVEPGVAGVEVPEQAEDQGAAAESGPVEVGFEGVGKLGDGEDEHDVEEDFVECDPVAGARVGGGPRVSHGGGR